MERNIHKIYDSQIAMVNSPICNEDDNQDIKTIQEADMEAKRRLREEFSHDTLKKMGNDDFGVSEIIGEAQINAIDFTGAKLQAITWEDINEAMWGDPILSEFRRHLKDNNVNQVERMLGNTKLAFPDTSDRATKVNIEDISLYKDCLMIKDRIKKQFLCNLHLWHRGTKIMGELANRSIFWRGYKADIDDFINRCIFCNNQLQANQAPDPVPIRETQFPYQVNSMDIC